uniref:Uncharacterized protein n=1 Tax=Oryza brachyantha TaxID=4533 RepID=J3LS95_ORYBR
MEAVRPRSIGARGLRFFPPLCLGRRGAAPVHLARRRPPTRRPYPRHRPATPAHVAFVLRDRFSTCPGTRIYQCCSNINMSHNDSKRALVPMEVDPVMNTHVSQVHQVRKDGGPDFSIKATTVAFSAGAHYRLPSESSVCKYVQSYSSWLYERTEGALHEEQKTQFF